MEEDVIIEPPAWVHKHCARTGMVIVPFTPNRLLGAKVVRVEQHDWADDGVLVYFDNGLCLDVGYSGDEGTTILWAKVAAKEGS